MLDLLAPAPNSIHKKVLAVRHPGANNFYYVFYTSGSESYGTVEWELRYTLVNITANAGQGEVVEKHQLVARGVSIGFTLVKHSNNNDFWLIAHNARTKEFLVYRASGIAGLSTTPTVNIVGMSATPAKYKIGDMKPSHDGTMVGIATVQGDDINFLGDSPGFCEVFDFNNTTGALSNRSLAKGPDGYLGGGWLGHRPTSEVTLEFSPDNRLVYFLKTGYYQYPYPVYLFEIHSQIWQFNLCYRDSANTSFYRYMVAESYKRQDNMPAMISLQCGPDKVIHVGRILEDTLGTIGYPDQIGDECHFASNNNVLAGKSGKYLPSFYQQQAEKALKGNITYKGDCYPAPQTFSLNHPDITSIRWTFFHVESSTSFTSTDINPIINFPAPGEYVVTADAMAYGRSVRVHAHRVEMKDPAKRLLHQFPRDTTFCEGELIKFKLKAIDGLYEWGIGSSFASRQIIHLSDSFSFGFTNKVYVRLLQNDCDGCTMIDSINVIVKPKPNISPSPDATICTGDSIQLNAYDYSPAGTTWLWNTGATTSSIWVKTGGTYRLRAEINGNGCVVYDTIEINENVPVIFSLPNDTTLCESNTLLLDPGVGNAAYNWMNYQSIAPTYLVTTAGTYFVEVTSVNGCSKKDTINVAYLQTQTIGLGNDTTICVGESLQIGQTIAGATYTWNTGASTATITVLSSGKYWVDAHNGLCTVTDTINVNFVNKPIINLGNDTTICSNTPLLLNAVTIADSYEWQNGSLANSFTVNQAGDYWVKLTTDGCSAADTINVQLKPAPLIYLGNDTTICAGQQVTLSVASPQITGAVWQNNSTGFNFTATNAGEYWVQVQANNDCYARDTINISTAPLPIFTLGSDTSICEGQTLMLLTTVPGNYLWNTGSTSAHQSVMNAGDYWLRVTSNGCSFADTINVTTKPIPSVFLGNDTTLCEGSLLTLLAGNGSGQYLWQNNSTQNSFTVSAAGTYFVKFTAPNNCSASDTIAITYKLLPRFNLGPDIMICRGLSATLDPGITDATFLWNNGSTQSKITVQNEGNYSVTATNICGSWSDEIQVKNGLCKLTMPNAFSPDGNNNNDVFRVPYPQFIKTFHMTIYNRYGQKVFETIDATKGWNGNMQNGQPALPGNYIWTITLTDIDDNRIVEKGHVLLIR